MPDANGNFKGMAVDAEAWERIFGTSVTPTDDEIQANRLRWDDLAPWQQEILNGYVAGSE